MNHRSHSTNSVTNLSSVRKVDEGVSLFPACLTHSSPIFNEMPNKRLFHFWISATIIGSMCNGQASFQYFIPLALCKIKMILQIRIYIIIIPDSSFNSQKYAAWNADFLSFATNTKLQPTKVHKVVWVWISRQGRAVASGNGWKITMATFSDLDEQIERLKRCEYLKESEVKVLCDKAREILLEESNVQLVDAPCTVWNRFTCIWEVVLSLQNSISPT